MTKVSNHHLSQQANEEQLPTTNPAKNFKMHF